MEVTDWKGLKVIRIQSERGHGLKIIFGLDFGLNLLLQTDWTGLKVIRNKSHKETYRGFKTKLDSENLKIQVPKINVQHPTHKNQKLKRPKNS